MTGAGGQARGPLGWIPALQAARTALLAVMVGLAAAQPTAAVAAEPQGKRAEAKVEFEKAQLHYRLGRFEEALQAYSRAYELFNAPALLFNIGQCHKNLQNHERAIFFFEGYLREETNAEKRALAEELIAVSRGELDRRRNQPPKTDPLTPSAGVRADAGASPPPEAAPVAVGIAPEPPAPSPVLVTNPGEETPAAREEAPLYGKWWFWTAIGVGAAVATGAAIYYGTAPTTTVPPSGSAGTLDRRR